MSDKKLAFLLLVSIFFTTGLLLFVLNTIGVVRLGDYFTFMIDDNPVLTEDLDYPTEVEKLEMKKREEKLIEKEEELSLREAQLEEVQGEIGTREKEIEELKKNILEERERLKLMTSDWMDRKKKIEDLASKVTSMPPEKAQEMMERWRDFDIIDVMRQIDKAAEQEGVPSITPYLLTLFTPERRAEITRKMLLPPLEGE